MTGPAAERVGVLGGTFDPVHLGHIASVLEVAAAFSLARVLLILSARPPHKTGARHASVEHRLAMLRLAARPHRALLEVSDLEARRQGPSYTADTLAELSQRRPQSELFLILGIDAYREIDSWHRPELIFERANVIVTTRPGHASANDAVPPRVAALGDACYNAAITGYVHTSGNKVVGYRIHGIDASASEIRAAAEAGRPFSHWLDAAVAEYIHRHRLYGVDPS